jgi:uncharacterized protein (DUF1697 family)
LRYVALLRGINVGGNNKVDMKTLVNAMESAGYKDVSTYINSGNIFFSSDKPESTLEKELNKLIQDEFGLDIPALVKGKTDVENIVGAIPAEWKNDAEMKCDVTFLWEKYHDDSVLEQLPTKPVDTVQYVSGAIIWKVDRQDVTKSGMNKIVGTDLYANMTIRNCNTARAILKRL